MEWINNFDLFLFDFDGLLVDTESLHLEAYQQLCARYGFSLQWTLDQFIAIAHTSAHGLREKLEGFFPGMFKENSWDLLYLEKKRIYETLLQKGNLSLMPGVQPVLEKLNELNKKRCVVTNSTLPQTNAIKLHIPILNTIPRWLTRESYQNPKPAPDGYLRALRELKADGDRVIGFEDSMRGYESLKTAGVSTAVLICQPSHPQLKAFKEEGMFVPSFNEMVSI